MKKLTDMSYSEIMNKASDIVAKLSKEGLLSRWECSILNILIGKSNSLIGEVDSTNRWAKEAFDENRRLIALLKDRWEAGWYGDSAGSAEGAES